MDATKEFLKVLEAKYGNKIFPKNDFQDANSRLESDKNLTFEVGINFK